MDPISIAMALAQFAPQVIKWVSGSDKAAEAAATVVQVAQQVTGRATPDDALAAIASDPQKALEFRQAVMDNALKWDAMFLADTQNARGRDVELAKAGMRNYRATALVAMAVVLVLLCLTITVWTTDTNDFIKATVTLVMGRALGWVDQVFSFEFGTTRSSATKDATINQLTK